MVAPGNMVTSLGSDNTYIIKKGTSFSTPLPNQFDGYIQKLKEIKRKLKAIGIDFSGKKAIQLTKKDYENYDFFLCMDSNNVRNKLKIIGDDKNKKVFRFIDFTNNPLDIADPWYTGDFDQTYNDIVEGCEAFLEHIVKNRGIGEVKKLIKT